MKVCGDQTTGPDTLEILDDPLAFIEKEGYELSAEDVAADDIRSAAVALKITIEAIFEERGER